MRRREFFGVLGGVVAARPFAARAQQPRPIVGFLNATSQGQFAHVVEAFRLGLREQGYIEGQNVAIEYRWADDHYERLPALAADLVGHRVNVIATGSATSAALAAKAASGTTPVVFIVGTDPVEVGLVTSLNRPGGNLTGVTTLNVEIVPKRLEALRELIHTTTVMALLVNPINSPKTLEADLKQAQAAATALGLQAVHVLEASTERDLENAFAAVGPLRVGGLVISADTFFSGKSAALAALALRYAVPAISPYREFARAGGLMSYGASVTDLYRMVGAYTGRILKGEKPSDLPVQQADKVELIVNLKTARTLGIAVPPALLGRADEVIE